MFSSILLISLWLNSCTLLLNFPEHVEAREDHIVPAFKEATLSDVCANRQVPIIQVDDIRSMINELKANPEKCLPSYVQAFYELEPILNIDKRERLCSRAKFDEIAQYHFRYVSPKKEVYSSGDDLEKLNKVPVERALYEDKVDYTIQLDHYNQEIMIPISLLQFFKAWALQVSGLCKKALVENLARAEQELNQEDVDLIGEHVQLKRPKLTGNRGSSRGKLPSSLPSRVELKSLVFMPELEPSVNPEDAALYKEKTQLDLRSDRRVDLLMHACKLRYKPIYSKLILPVVRLAKLGYNYMGKNMVQVNEKIERDLLIRRWLALTFICEAQGNYELVENEEEPILMEKFQYEPMISYTIENDLWIKGSDALRTELARVRGEESKGMARLTHEMKKLGRKFVAFVDPHQFAWYRRNQNTLSSVLNSLSIASNIFSISVSFVLGR